MTANTRPDVAIYVLDLAKKQKKATLKDLREVNRVLKKVHEKESMVVFKRIGDKKELCIIGVCDASYHCDDKSVAGEIVMLGNKETTDALLIYWKLGVIRKVCMSPKAADTRALIRLVDDGMSMARQLLQLIDIDVKARIFIDSRPLLESIGSSGQIEEKQSRQPVTYLKQELEDGEILGYSWI